MRQQHELDSGVKALEKQIPKKPTYESDGYAPDGTFVLTNGYALVVGKDTRSIMMIMISARIAGKK